MPGPGKMIIGVTFFSEMDLNARVHANVDGRMNGWTENLMPKLRLLNWCYKYSTHHLAKDFSLTGA